MKKRLWAICLMAALCILLSTGGLANSDTDVVTVALNGTQYYAQAYKVLDILNAQRAANGRGALTMDSSLMEAAMQRAVEIELLFEHRRPSGLPWSSMGGSAENIAYGYSDAQHVMTGWTNSKGHYDNMMTGYFTGVGIGCFRAEGGRLAWVQLFDRGVQSAAHNRLDKQGSFEVDSQKQYVQPTINPQAIRLGFGSAHRIVNTRYATTANSYRYVSGDERIATVNAVGLVTGIAKGETTISLLYRDGSPTGISLAVKVDPIEMNDKTCTVEVGTEFAYTGLPLEPAVKVYHGEKLLKRDTDYSIHFSNHRDVGTATVTIDGMGAYDGRLERRFVIKPRSLSGAGMTIELEQTRYVYTGIALQPNVIARHTERELVAGTDYALSYSNNTKVGTGRVKLVGKGNYTDTVTLPFTISKGDLAQAQVALSIKSYIYNGKTRKPKVTVRLQGNALKQKSDFTVRYSGNKKPGRATAIIKGKGNFVGTVNAHFVIEPKQGKIVRVQSKTAAQLYIQWTKDATVTRYEVEVCASPEFEFGEAEVLRFSAGKKANFLTASGLERGQTVCVRMRGVKTVGDESYFGAWSALKRVTLH